MKKVRAIDDIVFENKDVPLVRKGSVYTVGGVVGGGILLHNAEDETFLIDAETFEAGFEIAEV